MTDANRLISRRNAIALLAARPALGAEGALSHAFGCSPATTALATDVAQASARVPSGLLAAEHFDPLVGQAFAVGGQTATLRNVRRGPATPAHFRAQFAVVFDAPRARSIGSERAPVSHPAIGRHELLVTEVMDGIGRTALEICFS